MKLSQTVLLWFALLLGACSAALEPVVPTPPPTNTPAPTTPAPPTSVPVTLTPILAAVIPNTATFGPTPNPFPTSRLPTATLRVALPGTVRIEYFTSDIAVARPGDVVTLYWSVEGVTSATIYRLNQESQRERAWNVIRTGSLKVEIRPEDGTAVQYVLVVGEQLEQALTITVVGNLPTAPSPAEGAPLPAGGIVIVEQTFERGLMYWVSTERRVYVLYNEGQTWAFYADEFTEGQPESDPSITPPSGLAQPVRGFGLVWRTKQGVRERIGWATSPEIAYTGQIQGNATVEGGVMRLQARDGRMLELSGGGQKWQALGASQ